MPAPYRKIIPLALPVLLSTPVVVLTIADATIKGLWHTLSMTWTSWKPPDRRRPAGHWRQFGAATRAAGIHFRPRQVAAFCAAAMANDFDWSLSLERDPANELDPNAIKLIGIWTSKEARWFASPTQHQEQIGFVPAEYAAELAVADPRMPIAAELYEIAVASQHDSDGIGVIIKIILLVPSTLDPLWGPQSKRLSG